MKYRILSKLQQNQGEYVSGAELARELGISRTAVWKHIHSLRKEGYRVTAIPNQGYRLEDEGCEGPGLEPGLRKVRFGGQRLQLDETSSTNTVAWEMADQGRLAEGGIVIAARQTQGKGRRGRTWESPAGGLWFSIVLYPELQLRDAAPLSLVFALAVARALERFITAPVKVKWPNDVLLGGKKVAGILLEINTEFDRIKYLVAGIGVNVNLRAEDLPAALRDQATSLYLETGQEVDLEAVLSAILAELEKAYTRYLETGFKGLRRQFMERCAHFGQPVTVHTQGRDLNGIDQGVDDYGCLRLKLKDGRLVRVTAGDVMPG